MLYNRTGHIIAVLQEEGLFADSATSYLRFRDGVNFDSGSDTATTVCVRFSANYLRGQNSHFVSYANGDDTNAYLVYLKVDDRTDPVSKPQFSLKFCKHLSRPSVAWPAGTKGEGECVEAAMPRFTFHTYVHACAVHFTQSLPEELVKVHLYIEGDKVGEGRAIMISFFAFVDTFFELRRLLPGGRRFLRVWKHEQVKPKAVFATYLVYDLLTTMTS